MQQAGWHGPGVVMKPPGTRALVRFARPRRRLRAGLVQLVCAVAGLVLGLLLPRITVESTVASAQVSEALVAVGFGVLGLVSIIFSLLFLVVQWVFSSLSPRLNLFRDDPVVWRTFGFAIGVFVFSVTTTLVIGDQTKVSVIVPAAEVVAVLAALALIRRACRSKPSPPSSWRRHWRPSPGRAAASSRTCTPGRAPKPAGQLPRCRRGTRRSPGQTARPPCSNSTWVGCCAPLTVP